MCILLKVCSFMMRRLKDFICSWERSFQYCDLSVCIGFCMEQRMKLQSVIDCHRFTAKIIYIFSITKLTLIITSHVHLWESG
jgi:hypothetical protein